MNTRLSTGGGVVLDPAHRGGVVCPPPRGTAGACSGTPDTPVKINEQTGQRM